METEVCHYLEIPVLYSESKDSVGEFYSVAVTNGAQQADTGTKMIHLGQGSRSTSFQGDLTGKSRNTYRGLKVHKPAEGARNFTQCDSLLVGDKCGAHTVPYIVSRNPSGKIEHEATTSRISEDQLFYCLQRRMSEKNLSRLLSSLQGSDEGTANGICR